MGTHKLIKLFSTPERPKVRSGGARRDRTADLLHAMQALSQLSYGPTMLEAEFYAAVKRSPSLFSEISKKECRTLIDAPQTKSPDRSQGLVRCNWRPHGDSNPGRHRERVMS